MKKITTLVLTAAASVVFAACGAPANNAPANNTNTNTAKPTAAAPTAEVLFAMDKQANEAWIKGDKAYFENFLSEKFVSFERGGRMSRPELLAMIGSFKCDVKTWNLEDPQMAMIDADTYVMSYKGTFDGSCTGPDGKAEKLPSPVRSASIYVRDGDKWKGAFHSETMIIDPKAPPAAPAKPEPKKEEPKKDEKPAAPAAASPATPAATSAPAKPTPGPNTDALVKAHTAGWEAFKAKDAKKFDEMLTANASIVDPLGNWISGKANVIKHWTETMKCEGITKVSVTEGFATAISPTVEILTLKGSADGTCDGQKNGALYQSAVYVKEGETWKLAFMFESPAM
ncbi:MAG: nuclear transport factor 2 family protein [Pyrinomonadaceae bacterium]|nr:nuclear transport factor 2 family protein [Acidobacteriota bacterium]MBP7377154.1 nuclear transport factor 2 family protein [Pyrinomonadaceae bacterium]